MPVQSEKQHRPLVMDKAYIRYLADKMNERLGIVVDPTATTEQSQRLMLEAGIRPEDNEFSREIIRERERNMPLE